MIVKFPWDLRTPWKLLTQQVGMKAQRIALRLERFARIFYADHLSGCQTDHRAFLVIVSLAAVNQVAVLFVFQNARETFLGRKCGTGIFFQYLPGAGTVVDRDFKQFCFRGTGRQKDEHPLLVQPSAGDGVFHIVNILVEIARQVGRPWQVHEECPFVVGKRNFFFLATRQAGESDDKQYGKQAD